MPMDHVYDIGYILWHTHNYIDSIVSCTMINILFQGKSETVDLSTDTSLVVDISDALSERDKVKFTVHTKVKLQN